jgi:hypothetical protein
MLMLPQRSAQSQLLSQHWQELAQGAELAGIIMVLYPLHSDFGFSFGHREVTFGWHYLTILW